MVKRKSIICTEHLLFRLKIKKISKNLPKKIYKKADRFYFDSLSHLYVALQDVVYRNHKRTFMVAFTIDDDRIRLITIHPLKRNQELNRVKSGRWKRTTGTI